MKLYFIIIPFFLFLQGCQEDSGSKKVTSNPETPPLTTEPMIPDETQYPIYPGCEAVPTNYKREVILDGDKGETLQSYFDSKKAQPGDHIIVKGNQSSFFITRYTQPTFQNATDWTWIESQGATFNKVEIREVKKFIFTKLNITAPTGNLFAAAAASQIVLADSKLYGTEDSSSWAAQDWLNAPNGIGSDNSTCVSYIRNKLTNLRFGISASTRGQTSDVTSVKALISENELRNLSGDIIRPIGSDITVQHNKAYDGYLSAADGDDNHDDFIQGWAYPLGIEYSNVQILDNTFIEYTSADRKFKADYQGISVFDGIYSNYLIRGNIVLGSAYHGISMYWGKNGVIENNTVLSLYPNNGRSYWISVPPSKGGDLSTNIVVRNNIANQILPNTTNTGVEYKNNQIIKPADAPAQFEKFDVPNAKFDVRLKPSSPYYGKGVGALGE